MKIKLLLLFTLLSLVAFSQIEWAPIGAKWYFNRPSSESNDYVVFESTKDSTIQGKNVRVIDVMLNGTNLISQEYLHQNEDSLFYYNSNYNQFFLLYNFSAKAGDTITVHSNKFQPTSAFFSYNDSIPYFKYKINTIDSIQYEDHWIRRQKVENLGNSLWGFTKPTGGENDYILEEIGSITYFFGVFPGTYPEQKPSILRCYHESDFEYKNPLWGQDCDLISSIRSNNIDSGVVVFPNPCDDHINIQVTEPIESIEIFDTNGEKLMVLQQNKATAVINTSLLNKGCFLLKIRTMHHIFSKKIIKN